ncbi:hypothetical protein EBS67_18875, partial [bacterium]|nr:hypothetical protein [bacterium]
MIKRLLASILLLGIAVSMSFSPLFAQDAKKKKLILIAGRKSHGYGQHSFKAGCALLKKALDENVPGL